MKLVLLGTGGLMPSDQAQTACFFLPEVGVLLDAGSGLYRLRHYLQTSQLEVYLTHAHGDHTSGLIYLFGSYLVDAIVRQPGGVDVGNIGGLVRVANERLHTATRVHANQPALDFLCKEYEPYQMDWHLLRDQEELPGGGRLTSFAVGQGVEVGFRLDWPGHSLAYVTDTPSRPDEVLYLEQIRGVDVLLHDGYGPDRLASLITRVHHAHTSAVARIAALAEVGRVILVHKSPLPEWSAQEDLPAARAIFPNLVIGEDLQEIEF